MQSNDASDDDLIELSDWLSQLPGQIDYDSENGAVSRHAYLERVANVVGPGAAVAIYLRDGAGDLDFLTLAYRWGDIGGSGIAPKIVLFESEKSEEKAFQFELSAGRGHGASSDELMVYALCAHRVRLAEGMQLKADDLGIAVILPSKGSSTTFLMRVKLNMALRLFAIETARSRQKRLAIAIDRMLDAIKNSLRPDELCEIMQLYCRARSVFLFERRGTHYVNCGKHLTKTDLAVKSPPLLANAEIEPLVELGNIVRSHTTTLHLPKTLADLAGSHAWMAVPCETVGLDMETGTEHRYPQFLAFLVGKDNVEYLGEDYSKTDLEIARKLVSLLSNHLPYLNLSAEIGALYKEFDDHPLGRFSLKWFAELASKNLHGLRGLGVFPETFASDSASFQGAPFEVLGREIKMLRGFQIARGLTADAEENLHLLAFLVRTEYRANQKLVFAFADRYIQDAQSQLLDALVEYARSELGVMDFREYHVATQAQIRHVVRGSLSAAISELELIESRVRLYSNVPTKLQRLLETPTMQSAMADALLWLNEVYTLIDAPIYLLESFSPSSIRWSDVSPASIIRAVLAICKGEIQRRGLRVELEGMSADDSMLVSADGEFLKIVIFNLIDNALKYSFHGRWIKITLKFTQYRWRFEIENIGVPIRSEDKRRIFHPWVRSFRQYLANRRPGTGLGLAVSQRILSAHDPDMLFDCESDLLGDKPPTARTTFFFELDLKGKREGTG